MISTKKTKVCVVCQKTFSPKSQKGIYCHSNCASKVYRKKHPDKVAQRRKEWRKNNQEYENSYKRNNMKEYNRLYWANRRENDLNFKLKNNLRNRINGALRSKKRSVSIEGCIGCSIEDLKKHLESRFFIGMTWENHGPKGWHIDHIIPLCKFDLTKEEELKKACHYTNLQPLWWQDNLKKGCCYDQF